MADARVVAGPTRIEHGDPIVTASQTVTNHLTESSFDPSRRRVRFAPTSNLAVRTDLFRSLPFDERFPLAAGEDREWCRRLAELDIPIEFEPAAWVVHHPDLSLARFWRQQVRYGQGAYRLHRDREPGDRFQPLGFYTGLGACRFRARPERGSAGGPRPVRHCVRTGACGPGRPPRRPGELTRQESAGRREQRLAGQVTDVDARERGGGGGDVLEPRRT